MRDLPRAIKLTVIFIILCGFVYPSVIFLIGRIFPGKADGSFIKKDGKVVGSALIGQQFNSAGYFHGRPSAAGNGYDAEASGGSNLSATNPKLKVEVQKRVKKNKSYDNAPVPIDLVTASGSGLDPHISPEAAYYQIPRIAKIRNITENDLKLLVEKNIEPRQLGIFGEPRVNVLKLNMALEELK